MHCNIRISGLCLLDAYLQQAAFICDSQKCLEIVLCLCRQNHPDENYCSKNRNHEDVIKYEGPPFYFYGVVSLASSSSGCITE